MESSHNAIKARTTKTTDKLIILDTGISVRDPIEVSTIGNLDMGLELSRYLVFEESLRKSDSILASLGSG